ncbi:MAG: fluoride efflux transporter CrcB [Myxococcota bacterium]|jgi:CrcB protein|nr:fluoride efflux transporter CrcB [Myxococcota bacterium]
MQRFLLVCLGGAAGTGTRYLISLLLLRQGAGSLPWATLVVNVAGCLAMGFVVPFALGHAFSQTTKLALTTGFLGGLTTYSAFNLETTNLYQSGHERMAVLYLALTVCLCLAAGLLGAWLSRRFV